MRILLTFLISLLVFSSGAQGIVLRGSVYGDTKDNPLPFTNIAVVSTSQGTISDDGGKFSLNVSPTDSIYISYVGYQSTTIAIKDFKDFTILKSLPYELKTIEVTSEKRLIKRDFGFNKQKQSDHFAGPLQYAVFIQNTEGKPGVIKILKFKVSHAVARGKKERKYSQVRIRVYAVNPKRPGPGVDLLTENLIVNIAPGDKIISIDASSLNIPFPAEGVFIGLDVLGYIENNTLVNYYVKDAKSHLQIPFTRDVTKALTFINPTGKKWSLMDSFARSGNSQSSVINACFGVIVEY